MRKAPLLAAVLLAGAAAAAASAITVTQRTDVLNVFAERIDLSQKLVLGTGAILPAPSALGATAPVELDAAMPAARTAILRDQWTYAVDVREASADALPSGAFVVSLLVDNAPAGAVRVEQRAANPGAIEGARVTFNLGAALQPSALYYVEVKPDAAGGPTVAFVVRSVAGPKWEGVGGSIEGVANPSLSLPLGATLRLTARNADGGFHDVGIRDAGGSVVTPPGWSDDVDAAGEEVTLAWTPSAAGTYSYACKYHSSMVGALAVTSS